MAGDLARDVHRPRRRTRSVLAVGEDEPPACRVTLSVRVDIEPTGDESVRIRIEDSSAAPSEGPGTASGDGALLELATTAVHRYGGSLSVEQMGKRGKAVVLRFFRAFEESGEDS